MIVTSIWGLNRLEGALQGRCFAAACGGTQMSADDKQISADKMKKEIKGKKIEMSQVFDEKGRVVPVTSIKVEEWSEKLKPETPVVVTGTSKGKGFAGVMKRWGFHGGPATHGQSDRARAPGSIGGTTTPGRVYKGKKMPGRMGGKRVTVKGLKIVEADKKEKVVKVSGAIPGARNSKVVLKI